MNISGNTIFIPGSTSGIGLALAVRLQARGNTVIVGGRRSEELERIAAEHPGLDTAQIDTTDPASISAAGSTSRTTSSLASIENRRPAVIASAGESARIAPSATSWST